MKALHVPLLAALLMQACTSLQPTAETRDGVYDKPSTAPVIASTPADERTAQADDYYDPNAAGQYQRGYYDMAYNDPYYYNYGRFGFGYGMGWGSPWQHASWNTGYGWGSPYYNNWNDPWNNNWGYNGWGSPHGGWGQGWGLPYGYGWGSPYGYGWNDPWYGNGYGYGSCYGGSGFYGFGGYGNGCGCYQPIVVYGAPPVIAHRPSLGSGGNSGGSGGGTGEGTSAMQPAPVRPLFSLRQPMSAMARPATGDRTGESGFVWPERRPAPRPSVIDRNDGGLQREGRPSVHERSGAPSRIDSSPSRSTPGRGTGGGRTVQPRR